MSISVEAAEARDSLSDDKELVNTYEVIVLVIFLALYTVILKSTHKSQCVHILILVSHS